MAPAPEGFESLGMIGGRKGFRTGRLPGLKNWQGLKRAGFTTLGSHKGMGYGDKMGGELYHEGHSKGSGIGAKGLGTEELESWRCKVS